MTISSNPDNNNSKDTRMINLKKQLPNSGQVHSPSPSSLHHQNVQSRMESDLRKRETVSPHKKVPSIVQPQRSAERLAALQQQHDDYVQNSPRLREAADQRHQVNASRTKHRVAKSYNFEGGALQQASRMVKREPAEQLSSNGNIIALACGPLKK